MSLNTFVRSDYVVCATFEPAPTMFDDDNNNTGPVYLKHRNFAESAYRQPQSQPINAAQLSDSAFNSKAKKGNNISSYAVSCINYYDCKILLILYAEAQSVPQYRVSSFHSETSETHK